MAYEDSLKKKILAAARQCESDLKLLLFAADTAFCDGYSAQGHTETTKKKMRKEHGDMSN